MTHYAFVICSLKCFDFNLCITCIRMMYTARHVCFEVLFLFFDSTVEHYLQPLNSVNSFFLSFSYHTYSCIQPSR